MKKFFYIFLLLFLIFNLQYRLEEIRKVKEKAEEIIYLPKGKILKYLFLGERNSFADFLWLNFIQYYGHHLQTDRKFTYLYQILDVLTELDEKFLHAYTFGSVLLAHDLKDREKSEKLMKKGIYNNPIKWEYYFWLGFLNYTFFKDYEKAGRYFRLSSKKPGAPESAYRWAAFVYYKKLKKLELSLILWDELYRNSKNEFEKNIALSYIKSTLHKIHLRDLNRALKEFIKNEKRMPKNLDEMVYKKYIKSIPEDPLGGKYYIKKDLIISTKTPKIFISEIEELLN